MGTDKLSNLETTWTEFDPNLTVANTTCVVTLTHVINTNVYLEPNVTLIFMGGMITGNGTLKGDNTFLIAPIIQIFGSKLNFSGSWIVDRAYPQWFGAQSNTNGDFTNPDYDCASAINKAIKFKRTGEVFLPRGEYIVGSTIYVKTGIILCGERLYTSYGDQNNEEGMGTTIRPLKNGSFNGNFLIMVNTTGPDPEHGTWDIAYPTAYTSIKHIYFYNEGNGRPSGLRGILFAGGATVIDYCRWYGFSQAVASCHNLYSDNKVVTNCQFDDQDSDKYYAFDLDSLGDNLVFRGNGFGSLYGLSLNFCNGGEICDNIINSNVKIKNSKGITFASNHCEYFIEKEGRQLYIIRSEVVVSSNFFEKKAVPSIKIEDADSTDDDLSVVTLQNNVFAYYANELSHPYDIQTDGKVSLNISNCYRYWVRRDWINKMYVYGIRICDIEGNSYDSFNNYSYLLSTLGFIKPTFTPILNNVVNTQVTYTDIQGIINNNILWEKETLSNGSYLYSAQLVWDLERRILSNITSNVPALSPIKGENGVLLIINGGSIIGYQGLLRLIRNVVVSNTIIKTEYVDIPLCGSRSLYDNGLSICGFEWQDGTSITGLTPLGSIQFMADNVICRSKTCPSSGSWKDGDIVYNMGSSSCVMWIRINNSWVER